ncbi:MAG: hypothetical protein QOI03_1598 [Solirubrobacteraceae bacterium]|jgi:hypothetical protein|nr:hypothetical protein [Solirubrobacteraceae bacterium]
MFVESTLVYPALLAVLCLGAGALVDRCSGERLPGTLLLAVGAAALIAVSQLSTYISALAPATPYLLLALAAGGFVLARSRLRALARSARATPWPVIASLLVYAAALAPVLLAGRPTFSSYLALADSAVHMLGGDFLIRHGQDYAHLDLRNSYGQFVNAYYNSGYPSGADTLFGASASLLRPPLIWSFQPFNAFMLAAATGPAWLLARRLSLRGPWAGLAALTVLLGALDYAYELLGSVKEISAIAMVLTLGALAVAHRLWLAGPVRRVIPMALVSGAGVSVLGVGFGAWALVGAAVPLAVLAGGRRSGRRGPKGRLAMIAAGALTLLIAALPTWTHLSGSLNVTQGIASTANAGNLQAPLGASHLLGVWLRGSYKSAPTGASLTVTHILIAVTVVAAVLGAAHVLRMRAYALAGWLACMLLAWLAVGKSVSTWAGAKTLVLTAPVVMLLAWGAVASLGALASRPSRLAAWALALALTGGVLSSDALQYHSTNLAPTARYEELGSLDSRFAGRGPTLFTDFDEYALYELRDLDVGGPNFVYPPPALAALAGGHGRPVQLDRAPARALLAYPLIITRRDPTLARPPSVYRLQWRGVYYEVWQRRSGASPAIAHIPLSGSARDQCASIARMAASGGALLSAAAVPEIVTVSLARSSHPARWAVGRRGVLLSGVGRLSAGFALPRAGPWELWFAGGLMPSVAIELDGRTLAHVGGQLGGNSLVRNILAPRQVSLSAGEHTLALSRAGVTLAPGDGGLAELSAIFLTPAGPRGEARLERAPATRWRSLCGVSHQWVEQIPSRG